MIDSLVLRAEITRRWHASGLAPSHAELTDVLGGTVGDVHAALADLVDRHGVVLDGHGHIRIAHPFQTLPSACWIEAENRGWWSPCAWCALGSMAMAPEPTALHTTFGGEGERVVIRAADGRLDRHDWVLLITRPARDWWDDVACTCALNQLLPSVDDATIWSARHGFPPGQSLSAEQAWSLSQQWYARFLESPWRRPSAREARAILDGLGLRGAFWELPGAWT